MTLGFGSASKKPDCQVPKCVMCGGVPSMWSFRLRGSVCTACHAGAVERWRKESESGERESA